MQKLINKDIFRQHDRLKVYNKIGGGEGRTTSMTLQDLVIQIQELCNQHNIKVIYQHIPEILNTQAERLSRMREPLYESIIPKKMFNCMQTRWGS